MAALTYEERTRLLEDLMRLRSDADHQDANLLEHFLPLPSHERALARETMVVRGERGAGKSMLFKVLGELRQDRGPIERLLPRAEQANATWHVGFTEIGTDHPTTDLVASFVRDAPPERVRVMWMAHLVARLAEDFDNPSLELPDFVRAWESRNDIARWVAEAEKALPALTTALDAAERSFVQQGREVVVLYDHLDTIGKTDTATRVKASAGLLALWLSLSNRYRAIRTKIFLREDLFEASLSTSADATKVRSRSVALGWDVASLYRALIRQMASLSAPMREWIQDSLNKIPLREEPQLGWFPPEVLKETGHPSQAAFVEHLAGVHMGKGLKKGYVYRWIPDRLQDARGSIVPRSLVNLVAYAAENARPSPKAVQKRLLHPLELQAALDKTSTQRVAELAEESPVVARLTELNGIVVPIGRSAMVKLLSRSDADDGYGDDGDAAFDELARIGVVRERDSVRWDVPDLYRYGYGIKRKGGAPRPK